MNRALPRLWWAGYGATSMSDLVAATGASRHAIYSDFGDKAGLFSAVLAAYRESVVSPAFAPVEAPGAGLDAIETYFRAQIDRAAEGGLPGPGCLIANAMAEFEGTDHPFAGPIADHLERLRTGFARAYAASGYGDRAKALADLTVVFAQGLWLISRQTGSAEALHDQVTEFLALLPERPRP